MANFFGFLATYLDPFLDRVGQVMLGSMIILTSLSAIIIAIAAIRHQRQGIAVTVRVTALREGTDSDGNVTYAPEFEITDGPHGGTVWASQVASSPPDHAVGDILKGQYNPKTGVIHSQNTMGSLRFIAVGMLGMGALLLYVFMREL